MSGRRLYVGRLSQDVRKVDIEEAFGKLGPIVDLRMMSGFCFLEFESLKDAEAAVDEFHNRDFMGDRLLVEYAKPPRNLDPDRYDPRFDRSGRGPPPGYGGRGGGGYDRPPRSAGIRLVVSGLPDGTSWQDLKDAARMAGQVSYADVDRHNPTVGVIEYSSRADADEAKRVITEIRGTPVTIDDDDGRGAGPPPRRFDDYDRAPRRRYDDGYDRPPPRRYDDGYDRAPPARRYDDDRAPPPRRYEDDYNSRRRSVSPRRRSPTPV